MINYSVFKELLTLTLINLPANPINRILLIESYYEHVLHMPTLPIIKSIFSIEFV